MVWSRCLFRGVWFVLVFLHENLLIEVEKPKCVSLEKEKLHLHEFDKGLKGPLLRLLRDLNDILRGVQQGSGRVNTS